jgi:glutamine synthetase
VPGGQRGAARGDGRPLLRAFLAVRRAEAELFAGASPDDITAATRWRW